MSRHLRRLVAACLLAVVSAGLAAPTDTAQAKAKTQEPVDPLSVTIDGMTPSVISNPQQKGRITIRGRVRNVSDVSWSELVAYVVPGTTPMRTEDELTAAAASDPLTPFGSRLVETGMYVRLPDLGPGQSAPYRLSVPIRALGLDAGRGVYWLGVHVLGTNFEGRLDGADGRARTFLPVMRQGAAPASVDLVVPFRQRVDRAVDGSVLRTAIWRRQLSPGGRLSDLLNFVVDSPMPVSLLVDPAVVDAVTSLAAGNPTTAGETTAPPMLPAEEWARSFRLRSQLLEVLALPYGDTDTAAALTEDQTKTLNDALALGAQRIEGSSVTSMLAPLSGYLDPDQLTTLGGGHTVLFDPASAPEADAPTLTTSAGPRVVVSDAVLATPEFAKSSMAQLRQILLARLAVRSLDGQGDVPIVMSLPARWNPGPNAGSFFQGLDVPWVRGVGIDDVLTSVSDSPYDPGSFVAPGTNGKAHVPLANFLSAASLAEDGATLGSLLGSTTVGPALKQQSLLAVSLHARTNPVKIRRRIDRVDVAVNNQLNGIALSGPTFVTLSSRTGSFQVTVENNLDQDVTVGIVGDSGSDQLKLRAPKKVTIQAGQVRSVRVTATARRLGVYRVTVAAVTPGGEELPDRVVLSVRSSQVGRVIWLIFGAAGGILFLAISLRVFRRIRGSGRGAAP